jgi:hypothetical protein
MKMGSPLGGHAVKLAYVKRQELPIDGLLPKVPSCSGLPGSPPRRAPAQYACGHAMPLSPGYNNEAPPRVHSGSAIGYIKDTLFGKGGDLGDVGSK